MRHELVEPVDAVDVRALLDIGATDTDHVEMSSRARLARTHVGPASFEICVALPSCLQYAYA